MVYNTTRAGRNPGFFYGKNCLQDNKIDQANNMYKRKVLTFMKKILKYFKPLCYTYYSKKIRRGCGIMKGRYSAMDIATWFIYKTNSEKKENVAINDDYEVYEGLTHLKLQKLLYFAQGLSLALHDTPLFKDKIQAWSHGPVVPSVYKEFSLKGREEITLDDIDGGENIIRTITADSSASQILDLTYENFAIYTAWQLRNMTHEIGTPWYETYVPNKNKEIGLTIIADYFKKNIVE